MMETVRLVAHGIAAGMGWMLISFWMTMPVLWYLQLRIHVDPYHLVDITTVAWALIMGLVFYEGVEVVRGSRMPIRTHIGGLLCALGSGIVYHDAIPLLVQNTLYPRAEMKYGPLIWVGIGTIILIAGSLFWTFQPAPEEPAPEEPSEEAKVSTP
jgi:hypothetical protein